MEVGSMAGGGVSQAMSLSTGCALPLKGWRWPGFKRAPSRCGWARLPRRAGLQVRAVDTAEDCNDEDCAPAKEVGKISGEWLAEEKTKVVGTYPPLARQTKTWTGYVEKDTAGQTNIYSVEPTVYVAESAYSSGSAGSSAEGSENNLAIAAGLGLVAVASASSILLAVGKNMPENPRTTTYSGPPLSYYIQKFGPTKTIEASLPSVSDQSVISASFVDVRDENSSDVTDTVKASISNELDSSTTGSDVPESIPALNSESEVPAKTRESTDGYR
ncbi:hypothetical protein O6H91_12G057400 [Diphasiastrum complanatum]|uniref:Uncharacterized protein n=2 Tax=Diphasiastrum complanatum TaxID=34168 RepID=A0ACC2C299_DIPCM|nr:hypothetical protein O6H91_12G057400 [Diphasiastrum complanatum]KAJ7536132.1 hypothetical protein O6H91_12G057400 [Diphasiastrum complanatum]